MTNNKLGFAILPFLVIVGIFVGLGLIFLKPAIKTSFIPEIVTQITNPQHSDEEPPLLIKHLGFDFDDLDFNLTSAPYDNRIWTDFGHKDSESGKIHPQPIFQLPVGAKVYSIVDGIVVDIPKLYSGDYSIHIAIDQNSRWRYETEHVVNPLVKVGDRVQAGQQIAEVGPDNNRNYGYLDIGILKGGNPPEHVCPFAYLDPLIKKQTEDKIQAHYKAWEEFRNDVTIYNEESYFSPGCVVLGPVAD